MKSILVDFYNLKLDTSKWKKEVEAMDNWVTPSEDRLKIREFFQKYAPKILTFETATDIEAKKESLSDLAEYELVGSLGGYELRKKKSWFESDDSFVFYGEFLRLRETVDSYLQKQTITKNLLEWVGSLGEKAMISQLLKDKEGERSFFISEHPKEEIDLKKYMYLENWEPIICRWSLLTSELIADLHNELVKFLNGEIEMRKCEADDCGKIFVPTPRGRNQRFCSRQCFERIRSRKRRAKKK
jgi:hypothetical protein